MDRDKLKAWVERVKNDSTLTLSFLLTQSPDDSFGWGKILKNMWFPGGYEMPSGTGLLLVGPRGCGKHTAVHHMLRLLDQLPKEETEDGDEEIPYTCVFLEGEDLEGPGEDAASGRQRIDALLDDCYDRRRGLFLVLEDTAALPWSRKLYRYLETQLASYYLQRGRRSSLQGPKDRPNTEDFEEDGDTLPPFFLVLLEEEEPALPALLRSRLQLCRMSKPNLLRRKRFLTNRGLGDHLMQHEEQNPGQTLAELTEGMSYAQLEDLANSLTALTADIMESVPPEEEDSLRQEQAPRETLPELQRQVWLKAESLMDRLPELMAQRAVVIASEGQNVGEQRVTSPDSDPQGPVDEEKIENKEMKRLEELPVKDLAKEYFEEELELEPLRETN